jgi:WD40 repeat protein
MDRGEGIIRWSPNQARDEFLTLEINYRTIQRYKATGQAVPEQFDYVPVSKATDFQAVTAFDWSPKVSGLVAIGGKGGEVQLLRIDDNSNDRITLPLKLQRSCQAVAFNTTGLLAVGLDRVRNDQCLQIWDVEQRLSQWDPSKKGWQSQIGSNAEPLHKLEPSVSVTSVKCFEDQPQMLVAGIKNSSVRIHDLRDPGGAVITFQTRCNNNIAIDHADTNYFASSALDQPTVMVWDRRATSRQTASRMYLESVDAGDMTFGGVMRIGHAINANNNAYIRSLRYCHDRPGHLAVLSSAGELQLYRTEHEYADPSFEDDLDSPELLQVRQSHTIQYPFFDKNFGGSPDDRIVSSDWVALGSSELQPRLVARRNNATLEVLLAPTTIQHVAYGLIQFSAQAKHGEYLNLPKFADEHEAELALGPVAALEDERRTTFPSSSNKSASKVPTIPTWERDSLGNALNFEWRPTKEEATNGEALLEADIQALNRLKLATNSDSQAAPELRPQSSRERHESSLLASLAGPPSYSKWNHKMLQRCKEGYLFDCRKNREILSDDPWLQWIWFWIERAAKLASEEVMTFKGVDLSFMGVCNIWNHDIGKTPLARLIETYSIPSNHEWTRGIEEINRKQGRFEFNDIKTSKPHERLLCLSLCGWGKSGPELEEGLQRLINKGEYTKAAAWALYENTTDRAVEILRQGGDNDLLFMGLALNLHFKGASALDKAEWDEVLRKHPKMISDPYLRAIYALISTSNCKGIADEASLPLRDRVGVAVRHLSDSELTEWLQKQTSQAIQDGDIEGIVLTGITDQFVDILSNYVSSWGDYQTATLILSHAAPLYINDRRATQWRAAYRDLLNANRLHIHRCRFDVASTKLSRRRDGTTVIKPPPRQVTLRCVRCDSALTHDLANTANPPSRGSGSGAAAASNSQTVSSGSPNPLFSTASDIHAGICCPKCGRHLPRCTVCLQTLGMPRSERPVVGTHMERGSAVGAAPGGPRPDAAAALSNFFTFCLKCDHAAHADHARAWFARHGECPAPDCRCRCNEQDMGIREEYRDDGGDDGPGSPGAGGGGEGGQGRKGSADGGRGDQGKEEDGEKGKE